MSQARANVRLSVKPLDLSEANDFVAQTHRHHGRVVGHKFSLGLEDDGGGLRGVAICGRPLARRLDDGRTCEVLRLATDGVPNACSKLYGACARIAREMGFRRILTYILASEPGTSLVAVGWDREAETPGRSWSVESRPRPQQGGMFQGCEPDTTGPKVRWGRAL